MDGTIGATEDSTDGTTHIGAGTTGVGTIGATEVTTVMDGIDHGDGIDGTIGVMADLDLATQVLVSAGTVLSTVMDTVMVMATGITIEIVDFPIEAMQLTTQEEAITIETQQIIADYLLQRLEVVLM
ncbi:MAG TPA: hypothetical protein DCG42_11800 [Maribacter sp.]|nr:hypothetical protein [Maribacter sp.]|tara:strand:- start:65069 stop:65449 length:381 start_codon:yes stop_codon:yes gene_type:complete